MDDKGLSASQLARIAKVRKQRISDWLAGISPKDFGQIKSVADALAISLDALLYGTVIDAGKDQADNCIESFPESAEVVFQVTVKRMKEPR